MKKLVLLDPETMAFTEIDEIKLKRIASSFKKWLNEIGPDNDFFDCLKYDLPLVDAALAGTLELPFKGIDPLLHRLGTLRVSRQYIEISSPFYNTIRGEHISLPEIVEFAGKRYAWMRFESVEKSVEKLASA